MIEVKTFRTFIIIYALFKSKLLSANVKLALHKALIRSVMTCLPRLENSGSTYLLKLQRLQNKVLRTTANFPRFTLARDLYMGFNLPYVYDYVTKLCS
jgi:hypothetical protein